ncbi:MAG: MFS transporter [Pseudomonadota bacterium]
MAPSAHDSAYSWARLGLTLVVGSIGSAGIWMIVMIMPAVEADFGVGRGEASLPYLVTMLGFALGNFVFGRAVDRLSYHVAQGIAAVIAAFGYVIATWSTSIEFLIAAQFILGLGSAASFGPLVADISHWFMRRRGVAVSVAACGNYFAGAIWPVALGSVLAEDGWRAVYLWMAVITLTILPMMLLLRRKLPQDATAKAAAQAAARAASVGLSPRALQILLSLAGLACCVAMSMPQVHIVSYCVDLGYGPAVGAEMLALMLLTGVASRIISGAVMDWLGGVKTVLIGSVLQCLSLMLFLPFDGMVSLYMISAIFGLAQGGLVPGYAVIIREYMAPEEAGKRVGTVIMFTVFGMALGGWMTGWIYDLTGDYQTAFLNGIAWNLVNMTVMILLLTRAGGAAQTSRA